MKAFTCVTSLGLTLLCLQISTQTPLDDYVNKPDPTYSYRVIGNLTGPGYTVYNVNMTSQTWKPELQSQPVWWHYLTIVLPKHFLVPKAGFLFINGGSNQDSVPPSYTDPVIERMIALAITTGTVTANLKMVPNQPIIFKNDPNQEARTEDGIIAWTWKMFIEGNASDPEILLRMPMTKAAVRALDTMSSLTKILTGLEVNRFMVAGASKRGWTTWTVGAVDKRVIAIAPIVMDLLNMQKNLHHFYRALGGWTFEFHDYFQANFTREIDSPYIQKMADIIDPISYNERYKDKAKYVISATGDSFFMVDDSMYYFDQLKGPKYLRMIPNSEHSIAGHEWSLFAGITSFYLSVMKEQPLPELSWNLNYTPTGGSISVVTSRQPILIQCHYAHTIDPNMKDFRFHKLSPENNTPVFQPVLWKTTNVTQTGTNTWQAHFLNPVFGWQGFFIQVKFSGPEDTLLEFTTQALVIPNTDPYDDCHGAACYGPLV